MAQRSRWFWFVVLLIVSIGLSVLGTVYFRSPFLTLFLFFPFLPFMFGKRGASAEASTKTCPVCGYTTDDPRANFCPRDATRLRRDETAR